MAIALYMDVNIPRAITDSLRVRGVDVLTAQQDGSGKLSDSQLVDRPSALGRTIFTFDVDFLAIATKRQITAIPFSGIIYGRYPKISIATCVQDLELIGGALDPDELNNSVQFLPLR